MSGGAFVPPKCARCQKRPGVVANPLIGGRYCKPCDRYVTSPAPDLEAKYNRRVAERTRKEATDA